MSPSVAAWMPRSAAFVAGRWAMYLCSHKSSSTVSATQHSDSAATSAPGTPATK